MSNRGRQNVASYLALDLGIDWREGADWFESLLVDYDVCSNWGEHPSGRPVIRQRRAQHAALAVCVNKFPPPPRLQCCNAATLSSALQCLSGFQSCAEFGSSFCASAKTSQPHSAGNWVAAAGMTGGRLNQFNIVKQSRDYDDVRSTLRFMCVQCSVSGLTSATKR
jgi:hypothetical protein